MRKVTLLKAGNRIVVDPTTSKIRSFLTPYLSFEEKEFLHGWDRRQARMEGRPIFETVVWECFGEDHRGRLATSWGFHRRIKEVLAKQGYKVVCRDLWPAKDPTIFVPQWEMLQQYGIQLRHGQGEFLTKVLSHRCGRFDCPPGFGKSFLLGVVAIILPKARIDIVSKRVPVIRDRIYRELQGMLLDVGIVGGGLRVPGRRIMCYTADSAHHAKGGDADILFGDENHELVADRVSQVLGRWDRSRNYGLSASQDMRLDNKDLRAEGIFGPIIYAMDYQEAQEHGMVVPIQVTWHAVPLDYDICEGTEDIEKKRVGIWTNSARNDLVAKVARGYDADTQVLITTETIEHSIHLKNRLPDYEMVYSENGLSERDRRWYINHKLLDPKEPRMTSERRQRLTRRFETGKLKKAICTTVWNVGVNFRHLTVLIRADGGGSPVNDVQIPGRVSRTSAGKTLGIVHDFLDEFNSGLRQKAMGRRRSYKRHGWQQIAPAKPKRHAGKKPPKELPGQKHFWEPT